ncbi:hypothetical protein Skr01_22090 [Sphaerisporangium krabiense]|uniref:Uncharacterized protein (TIGR02679 family) n=1 Tax=Sphaerisporangium krabiense TaxID=763782 RepID=A0A7W8Z5X9_9ACTN|nr:TIGR02679 family protein [Sphaerisporangium krabiense]MBB5627962.1 uncharacterized protein (TIGR02679 family) [Sphaerisporangium krabiense]GII62124.1 hypothetical protein Skr01_22090 [Sphaerisporangium krabiense]
MSATYGIEGLTGDAYKRLFANARKALERNGGDLGRSISVKEPSDEERHRIHGLLGGASSRPGVQRITVSLGHLDAKVRASIGLGLVEFLEHTGGVLRNRPAERAASADAREGALRAVEASPLHESCAWYRDWSRTMGRDGTLTRLLADSGPVLTQAIRVLERIEARRSADTPVMLPDLAAEITRNPKALDHDKTLSMLVLRALAVREDVPRPGSAEERRELWEAAGVVPDDLASRVLVLNLPAQGEGLGEWLSGAARSGTPFQVTLHQLTTLPIMVSVPVVHVCENPAVLRRAAAELGDGASALICTEGRPSTAFHRVARAVVAGGGVLRYHGDFDWPGVAIAASVMERHGARPWRMSAADFLAGLRHEGDEVPLTGRRHDTPWDPALAEAMERHGRAVYEESVAENLIADLARKPPGAASTVRRKPRRSPPESGTTFPASSPCA